MNGQLRGKRVAPAALPKVLKDGVRTPMSSIGLDVWDTDTQGNGFDHSRGDLDGVCEPTGRGLVPLASGEAASVLVPLWMRHEDGQPFSGDPRRALAHVLGRFEALDLMPMMATEVEFYLLARRGRARTDCAGAEPSLSGA